MAAKKDVYLVPRLMIVMAGFILIVLSQFFLGPWLKLGGGFLALYAFTPDKINPLLQYLGRLTSGKEQKRT